MKRIPGSDQGISDTFELTRAATTPAHGQEKLSSAVKYHDAIIVRGDKSTLPVTGDEEHKIRQGSRFC